jgi:hypothetical protein
LSLLLVEVGLLVTCVYRLVRKTVLLPDLLQLELLLYCAADCVADFSEEVLVGLLNGVSEQHGEHKRMAPSLGGLLLQRLLWLRCCGDGGLKAEAGA